MFTLDVVTTPARLQPTWRSTLPEDVERLVEAHLADCASCREYLHQMRQTIAMTRQLTDDDVDAMPADVRERLMQAFRERNS
jgi:predicted anti-sigma-YlaC factor YlaD